MSSGPAEIQEKEKGPLLELLRGEGQGLQNALIGGEKMVFQAFYFTPFQWYLVISEKSGVLYSDANRITLQTLITLVISIAITSILLIPAIVTRLADTERIG